MRAQDNELTCTRRCGGRLLSMPPLALPDLDGCDLRRLPYPVALTAQRLTQALQTSSDILKTLFLLKDCFEATIKQLAIVMLTNYRLSSESTPERTESLLKTMVRPSLGSWVSDVARPLSLWLVSGQQPPGNLAAALFATPPPRPGGRPAESAFLQRCKQFVTYRNDALGHGAQRSDAVYERDLGQWLSVVRQLLDGVAALAQWRFCLVTAEDRCQVWMGPEPGTAVEPGGFTLKEVGRFVLRRPGNQHQDLFPFLCYLPDRQQENRLHYYDSLYRYQATKKEANVLEYDNGERHPRAEPALGLEEHFTADLLARAFQWHRGRMEIIEGRVTSFSELIEGHAAIVGRQFVIDRIHRFLADNDRGLLMIEAQPGKGKTALMAHLIEQVFDQHAPAPVHFFYRHTAGITDPAVCVRSLYYALLRAHDITEAEESKQKNSVEELFTKLTNLLAQDIARRLMPGRPQLLLIDALDESTGDAFQHIPDNLPAGVYVIATTRHVARLATLARRQHLHWLDLDAPDFLQENLQDGFAYVQRELLNSELSTATLEEIARVGAGNFLVLKHLCQHARITLRADGASSFLQRLTAEGGKDQLGFIYEESWNRLTDRCSREDVNLLCDVAGMLLSAYAPLTPDLICGVLGLRAADWDFALRQLAEYLEATEVQEERLSFIIYQLYHKAFAEFLRSKLACDRRRFCLLLADYCLTWADQPESYSQRYALTFGILELLRCERDQEAQQMLCDLNYQRARIIVSSVDSLIGDYYRLPLSMQSIAGAGFWHTFLCAIASLSTKLRDFDIRYFLNRHHFTVRDAGAYRAAAPDQGIQRFFLELLESDFQIGPFRNGPQDYMSAVVNPAAAFIRGCALAGQVEYLEELDKTLGPLAKRAHYCLRIPGGGEWYDGDLADFMNRFNQLLREAIEAAKEVRIAPVESGLHHAKR
jgi:hypothetical protein